MKAKNINPAERSFVRFILYEKRNRNLASIAIVGAILQFIVFKHYYPFADFFSDSYSYIYAAHANLNINQWPIGYSRFLRVFRFITHSDTALVGFQYFFLELAAAWFYFTLLFFYRLGRTSRIILFAFLFFNPLFLYISNYVNSDPLFAALSLLWLTQLLWVIHQPALHQILVQGLLLFACFTVRNNAYYYPFISALAFLLSGQVAWRRLAGALFGVLLIVPFIRYQQREAFRLTGKKQFSLFTGWQLANNALYMRGNIRPDTTKFPSAGTMQLDSIARDFYRNAPENMNKALAGYVANYFVREPISPLKQYYSLHYNNAPSEYQAVVDWGKASIVYEQYGKYLIKRYPISYAWYFMFVNAKNYFLPPLEKLEVYNLDMKDLLTTTAQDWFDYRVPQVYAEHPHVQAYILYIYPAIFMFINVYLVGNLLWFIRKRRYRQMAPVVNKTLILFTVFHVLNFCFCVFATMIVLRYQFFPMIVCLAPALLLTEALDRRLAKGDSIDPGLEGTKLNLEIV